MSPPNRHSFSGAGRRAFLKHSICAATMMLPIPTSLSIPKGTTTRPNRALQADAYDDARQGSTPVLEPAVPIIDAHHHLWETAPPGAQPGRYQSDNLALDRAESGHNIVATIYAQCYSNYRNSGPPHLRCVGETEYIESVAAAGVLRGGSYNGNCRAIVGFADLTLGNKVEEVLEAHLCASPTRFRGIRQITIWEEGSTFPFGTWPNMLLDARFRSGFSILKKLDLSFDAWIFHSQIPQLTALARAFPDVRIVLDHLGTPLSSAKSSGVGFEEWRHFLSELSTCPNVAIKLGGLVDPIPRDSSSHSTSFSEPTRSFYEQAIEMFSPSRCMFESNFPVTRPDCSYRAIWNAYKSIAVGFSASEKAALFHDTAAQIYRISDA